MKYNNDLESIYTTLETKTNQSIISLNPFIMKTQALLSDSDTTMNAKCFGLLVLYSHKSMSTFKQQFVFLKTSFAGPNL